MITKIDKDTYHITTMDESIDMCLSYDDLFLRLTRKRIWSPAQVEELKGFEIGDSTKPIRGIYKGDNS